MLMRKFILAVGMVAAIAACGVLPDIKTPTDLYTLSPKSTFEPNLPNVYWQMAVETPVAPANLNTGRMALSASRLSTDYYATSAWTEAKEGLSYVREERWILIALLAATVSLLCTWGPWETLVPYIVKNDLDGSAVALSIVFGAGGFGSVMVALVFGRRGKLPRKPFTVLYLAWALGMLMTAGFGVVTSIWQAALVAMISEGSITVLIIVWYTLLQRLVPSELLGRVASLDWLISAAGVPVSFAIVGPLSGAIGVDATLIAAGIAGAVATIAFMYVRGARDPERDGRLEVAERSPVEG